MIAKRLGTFVRAGQVPEVWAAVAAVFRDYGYRRLRHRARIKFLIADWGAGEVPRGPGEGVPRVLAARRARPGQRAPARPRPRRRPPAAGRPYYVGFAPRVGRLNGELLAAIADLADRYGSGRVRTTAEQKMVILDVPDASVDDLVDRA